MNGPESVRRMRELGFAGIIIGVTGDVMEAEINGFQASGADVVLAKPLDMNEFYRIVCVLISNRRLGRN